MSDEKNCINENEPSTVEANTLPEENMDDSTQEVDELTKIKEILALKEKEHLYLQAEYDNYRKQSLKEKSNLLRFAGENFARELLSVLDVFEKAFTTEVTKENYTSFVEGMKLTEKELRSAFLKNNIRPIECRGKVFDPNTSEALSQVPTTELDDGHVLEVMRKGYFFHDKVLRHAQVVLATTPPSDSKEP